MKIPTKKQIRDFNLLMQMVGINMVHDNNNARVIIMAINAYRKMKGKFDIRTAAKIRTAVFDLQKSNVKTKSQTATGGK